MIGFSAYEVLGIGIPNPRAFVKMLIPEGLTPEQLSRINAEIDRINAELESFEDLERLLRLV